MNYSIDHAEIFMDTSLSHWEAFLKISARLDHIENFTIWGPKSI